MNVATYEWVAAVADYYKLRGRVVEVGARCINGSARSVFVGRASSYTGVDLEAGPCVDVVADALAWAPRPAGLDGVVATEVLEHVADPGALLRRARGWLRPAGWLLVTTRGPGFPRHEYPGDNGRRWTAMALRSFLAASGYRVVEAVADPTPNEPGAFALARRRS